MVTSWTLESLALLEDEMFSQHSVLTASGKRLIIEFAEVSKKTKPRCTATPCGFTCISNKYTCSSKILKRDADALIKSAYTTRSLLSVVSGLTAIELADKANWYDNYLDKVKAVEANRFSIKNALQVDKNSSEYVESYNSHRLAADTRSMVASMASTIKDFKEDNLSYRDTLHVALAKDGSMAGIMALSNYGDYVYVSELLGHPGKLLGDINPNNYNGAGTTLLVQAARIAKSKHSHLELYALPSAELFYKKLGFKNTGGEGEYSLKGEALDRLAGAA